MRSRFSAFARGLGTYLLDTLAADHPDRKLDTKELVLAFSRAKDRQRFLGLTIFETKTEGDRGEVFFHARLFERGMDRSFDERSTFVKEAGGWRYLSGVVDEKGEV